MHCLFAGIYYGEKMALPSFFQYRGCTNPRAISASGFMTRSRSAINRMGRINFAPEGSGGKYQITHKTGKININQAIRYICR